MSTITVYSVLYNEETDEETEVEVECEYSKYYPAKTYGPPENCYPEEGGYEGIVSVRNQETGKVIPESEWAGKINEDDLAEKVLDALINDD